MGAGRRIARYVSVIALGGVLLPMVGSTSAAALAPIASWAQAQVPLAIDQVAYDPVRDRVLVTVPATNPSLGNELVELDPDSGAVGRHVLVGSEPGQIALTSDGSTAFVALRGAPAIVEVDLVGFTVTDRIDLGADVVASDIETMPGRNDVVVAALEERAYSDHVGVVAFEDGARLPAWLSGDASPSTIEATSSTTLFGLARHESPALHFTVTLGDDGLTAGPGATGAMASPGWVDVEYANGRLYSSYGHIVDPATYQSLGTFAAGGFFAVTADNRIVVAAPDLNRITVHNATTGAQLATRTFPDLPDANRLVATADGVVLAGSPGVTLLGPSANGQAFVLPPPPTSVVAGLHELALPFLVNDLLYDEPRDRLYASIASASGTRPGQLVALDPGDGTVLGSVSLGSNPGPLAMADDGSVLHVGLTASGRIARIWLSDFTKTGDFLLGSDGTDTLTAEDIAVRPGTTDELLVALERASSLSFAAVALFVDGVRRPTSHSDHTGPNHVEFEDAGSALGLANETGGALHRLAVSDDGVASTGVIAGVGDHGADFRLAGDRAYVTSGEVVDRATGDLLGTLPVDGPIAIDAAEPRAYVADHDSGGPGVTEVDTDALRPVARLALQTGGTPGAIADTGSGAGTGLAVALWQTSTQGRLVLLTDQWGRLHTVAPARLADSRTGLGTPAGMLTGAWRNIQVTGVGGVPSTGVAAVVVNLTAVGAAGPGYLSAWPSGQSETFTSNVNYRRGQVVANQAIVPVGTGGRIAVTAYGNATHLIVDVQGWFGDGADLGGSSLHPVSPQRLADSRSGLGLPAGRLGTGVTRSVQVTGVGDVPASGVQAVVVNVTSVGALAPTHLTLWPTGQARPSTSNLNIGPGVVVANQAIVPVGTGGRINVFNAAGATHVILDVQGWFGADGALFRPLRPARIADTRLGHGLPGGMVAAGAPRALQVTGVGGVPSSGVTAVVVNLTVTGPTAASHLTAWPTGEARPGTSNVNFGPYQTVANQAIIPVGADGRITIANAVGSTHVVVDVQGWFGAP